MKKAMLMTAAMLACGAMEAVGRQALGPEAVRVQVYCAADPKVPVDGMMVTLAQDRASKLLADSGIRLQWHWGKPLEADMGRQVIAMAFVPTAPPQFDRSHDVLAAARPFGNGSTIMVFYDRVMAYLGRQGEMNGSKVLGHILAHEIVHVLQRTCRHSETGLMMPHWGRREMAMMTGSGLRLAEVDRELLQLWFVRPVLAGSGFSAASDAVEYATH